ncbi:TPA: hypothetical protein EYP44_00515 [Candidatus Bathyarchaeota archaeon]|nr:hypothetical protein [Candidatus Bathyarchaeota archaeon]
MRMLLIHGDFRYRTRERVRIRVVEEATKGWEELKNVLVVFTCVERQDEGRPNIASRTASEIAVVADRVKAGRIALYPYAHLSDSLARAASALSIIKGVGEELERMGYKVTRSPFGFYKEFILHCYGHPLAESFRAL